MLYKLSKEQYDVLINIALEGKDKYKDLLKKGSWQGEKTYSIELNEDESFELSNICQDEFTEHLDSKTSEPTKEGKILDDLAGIFLETS